MVLLKKQDTLTIREKLSYMISRAVLMPLGITLVLFAFQVYGHPNMTSPIFYNLPSGKGGYLKKLKPS